ncbi:hypothetical protein CYMTET_32152 [Cymbomonas tetramitiformis]|uniref:Major facilitator superfamily (MFS) profile domain-containing protein n=1 Tax=Cymbomonas tetramitiformis TaxID=36881 RepID=A0AAE0FFD9_9CHLO|nr:hypothetical protein CYMTET_32152 [Cymbomonas tetramitiformis]
MSATALRQVCPNCLPTLERPFSQNSQRSHSFQGNRRILKKKVLRCQAFTPLPAARSEFKRRSVDNWRLHGLKTTEEVRVITAQPESITSTDTQIKDTPAGASDPFKEIRDVLDSLPPHYRVVASITLAFVICNMDKVNISVAIIPMSMDLGWDASTAGFVQSAFFWGYAAGQLPGGFLSTGFGGKKVLLGGVFLWSAATAALPLAAHSLPALFVCRGLTGLGEGVSPPAAVDLIAKTVPKTQRSTATAIVFGGLQAGSIIGLLSVPAFISAFGWESVFYVFGVVGIAWVFVAESLFGNVAEQFKQGSADVPESARDKAMPAENAEKLIEDAARPSFTQLPWRRFASYTPLRALMYTHFCNNWGHYAILAWLPSYYSQNLDLDLQHAAFMSLLPPVASICTSSIAAPLADRLISEGRFKPTQVRKGMQCVGFLGPSIFLAMAAYAPLPPAAVAACITIGLGLTSASVAGLYSNHQDMSSKYASVLLGITNTIGALPGVFGVAFAGHILSQNPHDWNSAIFLPTIFFYVTGAIVYATFGDASPVDFDDQAEGATIDVKAQ